MLKYLSLIFCALLITSDVDAQDFVVTALRYNTLILNTDNPVKVVVENTPISEVYLKTSNGKIEPYYDEPGVFNILPDSAEKMLLRVYLKGTNKLIGTSEFRVQNFHRSVMPKASVGARRSGQIRKSILCAQLGIVVSYGHFEMRYGTVTKEYTCIIMRGDKTIFSEHFEGPYFDKHLKSVFKTLQKDDKVVFCFIDYLIDNKRTYRANAVELTIAD